MDTIYYHIQDICFPSALRSSNRDMSASISLKKHQPLCYQSASVHCEQYLPAVLGHTPMSGYLQFSAKTELLWSWRWIYTFRQLTKCWRTLRDIYHAASLKSWGLLWLIAPCFISERSLENHTMYTKSKYLVQLHKAWGNCCQLPGTQEGRQMNYTVKHMHVHR